MFLFSHLAIYSFKLQKGVESNRYIFYCWTLLRLWQFLIVMLIYSMGIFPWVRLPENLIIMIFNNDYMDGIEFFLFSKNTKFNDRIRTCIFPILYDYCHLVKMKRLRTGFEHVFTQKAGRSKFESSPSTFFQEVIILYHPNILNF